MNIAKQPSHEQGGAQSSTSVSSDSETDNEYAFVVEPHSNVVNHPTVMKTDTSRVSTAKSSPQAHLKIHKTNVNLLIDFGATINILDPRDFQAISQHYKILVTPTRTKVKAFGSDRPVELSGKFDAVVESKKRMTFATFYVTKQENGSLLSCNTSHKLGLIHFPCMQSDSSSKNRSAAVKLKKASRTTVTRNRNPKSKSQTPVGSYVVTVLSCQKH